MKKWRCTVCNYIHTGEEPPDKCPVCGADKDKFVEIGEEEAKAYESGKKSRNQKAAAANRPADAQKAANQESATQKPGTAGPATSGATAGQAPPPVPETALDRFNKFLTKHHAHPVAVHVPNGVLPVVVLFMFIAAVFAATSIAQAAFYFATFTLLFMPVVLYTGINVWQKKYRGAMTKYFIIKLVAAGVVTVSLFLIVIWYFINPQVVLAGAARRGGFLVLNLIMLGAASVAGWIGGKFVFRD